MPTVTFIRPDGQTTVVNGSDGASVMQAAVNAGVTEIVAECGGTLACATCHVYVQDGPGTDALPSRSSDEDEMLDFTACARKPNSRLSCQLPLNPRTDGLVVRVPAEQY